MKEHALSIARQAHNPAEKLNRLREYLQAFILRSLHEMTAFNCLSFVGGTALRFLYDLPRFSEDLDFCLEPSQAYKPNVWLTKLKRDMQFANFDVTISWNEKNTVHNAWVSVSGLLKELGLSAHPEQNLSVKIEIDTKPPAGAITQRKLVNKYFLLALRHYDLASLMAGKIHALACRPYPKGRDWYDLLWYTTQKPPISPNLDLLQHALEQTEVTPWPATTWKATLHNKLQTLNWPALIKDVAPFLERPQDRSLLTVEFITQALLG